MITKSSVGRVAVVLTALGSVLVGGFWAGQATAERESQPQMRSALANLRQAKGNLQQASSDKGGHRVAAVRLVDQAIAQTQAGIEFDNKNPRK